MVDYTSGSQSSEGIIIFALSDTVEANGGSLDSANKGLSFELRDWGGEHMRIIDYSDDSNDTTTDAQVIPEDNIVYATIARSSNTVTVSLYSDSGRTVLEDSITTPCSDSFRYLSVYGISSHDLYVTGYTENIDLGGEEEAARRIILIQ